MLSPKLILSRVINLAAQLPEMQVERMYGPAKFSVRGRTVAWFLDDHHGDGMLSLAVRADFGENEDMARMEPDRYYVPAYIGPRGWMGMRLDGVEVDWHEVARRLAHSYEMIAPKRLVKQIPRQG